MKQLRVIIAGGGTGGHIFPAVAIGHAIQRLYPGSELLFVGAIGKMEMEKVPNEGFKIVGLDIAGFNRSNLLKNITLPLKLLKSRIQARKVIKGFQPDVIVGVGGYASFPVLYAGQAMGIPTLIQEQNSFAGKSNKILGRRATAICVAYEGMSKFFPASKLVITGNPVRKSLSVINKTAAEGKLRFGFSADKPVLLVVGGSLGAKSINEAIDAGLDALTGRGMQILWQCGKQYLEKAVSRVAGKHGVVVFDFIKEMDYAYAAASIVVSRAGALAIAELCIAGKPVIFVPYPFAAEGHQESNARSLADKGAALMVANADASLKLVPLVLSLLADSAQQNALGSKIKALEVADADERIAKKVMEIVKM